MAILVTGGAGYIGSHTCVELLNSGQDIVIVDNFSNCKRESLARVSEITRRDFIAYEADLLDKEKLETIFKENKIDAVIHFAGLKAVGESVEIPLKYYQNNISSTVILCEVMNRNNVKKLVFSSSATVYGMPDRFPISEDFPLRAMNPYGRTKLMIEEILQDLYNSDNDWSIAILRYFNPIGAHKSGLIGEDPKGIPNNLMPFVTQVAIGNMKQLNVFGNKYPTIDGTGVRDYIHVVDLALGHLKALDFITENPVVEAFNLGTGTGYSVLEIVSAFERATGIKIPYQIKEPRPGDVGICYADPSKANNKLEWFPKRGIEEMCEDAWRWQSHNPTGYDKGKKITTDLKRPHIQFSEGVFFYELEEETKVRIANE